MSSPDIIEQQYQDPWEVEDEKLLQLCIEHEPSSFWDRWFSSNKQEEVNDEYESPKKRRNIDPCKPMVGGSDESSSDDDVVFEKDPWQQEDELLLEVCIQYDPWYNCNWAQTTQKSSSAVVGNLRRVSSVGNIRRVHSRTRLA